jgi:hypothetical protein
VTEQDPPAPAETAIAEEANLTRDVLRQYWALRDLTEAAAEVAGRMFDLPEDA